jgi:C_GCAxxG_C_C family probable redox protein
LNYLNAGGKSRIFQNHIKKVIIHYFNFLIFLTKKRMNKTDRAIRYFREGYSCSQAVLMACAGESGEVARMAAAFGGGMGRMQKTCGAVTGAYIWFGLAYGAPGLPGEDDKTRVYDRVKEFNRIFTERNGTDQCSELLGHDLNKREGKERISRLGLTEKVCEKCIRDSVGIIESLE